MYGIKSKIINYKLLKNIFLIIIILSSCTIPRKFQEDKPFVFKTNIEIKGGNFTKDEKYALKQRLSSQLDDSMIIRTKDRWLVFHYMDHPPAFDTAAASVSARNMQASMYHVGYYFSTVTYKADTINRDGQQRVKVNFIIEPNRPTLIDTIAYSMHNDSLQHLVQQSISEAFLKKGTPVTKENIQAEIERLVTLFRKNGYYKFSADELRVRGDTTIEALTTISDDPFEQLQILAEAKKRRDSPQIKLAIVLNETKDSSKIRPYYINNIIILPDYQPGDRLNDSRLITDTSGRNKKYIVKYHNYLFKRRFLRSNLFLRPGDLYNIENYNKTLNSFYKKGVWQSINIEIVELKDSINKIDMIVQLMTNKRYGFEAALEASYTDKNNTNNLNAGLFGVSANVSLLNRNINKEAIRMTHSFRAGIELNSKSNNATNDIINSNELSYSNNIFFPKFITPFNKINNKRLPSKESFINTNFSLINRINLFNLQTANVGLGYTWNNTSLKGKNKLWTLKPMNVEFSYLYNKTDAFQATLDNNPFLKYSFNTALVMGSLLSRTSLYRNPHHPYSTLRERSIKWNLEESGLLWGRLGIFKKYLRQYIKADMEYKYVVSYGKTALAFRLFGGIGIAARKDTTLPIFKQYFGGGSNSMRAWPIRGIGRGSQPLIPFNPDATQVYNDRTGDLQLEGNAEYRYNIAQIIPNSLILKGALFMDVGNVWNIHNTQPDNMTDSAQFKLKNLYKQLGVAIGTGLRLDFNYFVLRLDAGFRFKRPDILENDGWQIPNITYKNVLSGNTENKAWRHDNFNFTIGINYAF